MKTDRREAPAQPVTERLLTIVEVSHLLAVSARTIWRMRDSGELPPPVRVSRNLLRWRATDIRRFMDCGCDMAAFDRDADTVGTRR